MPDTAELGCAWGSPLIRVSPACRTQRSRWQQSCAALGCLGSFLVSTSLGAARDETVNFSQSLRQLRWVRPSKLHKYPMCRASHAGGTIVSGRQSPTPSRPELPPTSTSWSSMRHLLDVGSRSDSVDISAQPLPTTECCVRSC